MLCGQESETADHLLSACVYTRQVWLRVLRRAGFQAICPTASSSMVPWWITARASLVGERRKAFDALVLLIAWTTWKEHNRRTFDNIARSEDELFLAAREEALELVAAGFSKLAGIFSQ